MGTHALARFRFTKRTERSTARSRITGNFERGSRVTGWFNSSISAEHAIRARPLMRIAQEPQTSSRQFESYVIGREGLPSRVTGFAAISIIAEITFIPGFQGRENSSQ